MITIEELFETTHTINRVVIHVRDHKMKLLHTFFFGEGCTPENLIGPYRRDWEQGRLSLSNRKINAHGDDTGHGPEMGYGFKKGSIPDELMTAQVTNLHMRCLNGIDYAIVVDLVVPAMVTEIIKTQLEADDE